jgi:leader peptidase (prepilin peptidase)/N-methyltransferase
MLTALTLISIPLGLAFGSFATVLATRGLGDGSFVSPGSQCDVCATPLRPRDNIPVVSWLLLRGRCHNCAAPIPISYPITEIATAGTFALVTWTLGLTWTLPAFLALVTASAALTLTDVAAKRLPNRIVFPADAIGAVLLTVGALLDGDPGKLVGAAIGAVGYSGLLLIIHLIAPRGLGFGDVKLAVLLGMFLGYLSLWHVALGFFLAYLFGGLISIFLVVTRVRSMKDAIPFGPYMMVAAMVVVLWGEGILDAYLGRG